MKLPIWFWLLLVLGAALVGRALGWSARAAASAPEAPTAPAAPQIVDPFDPPPPPGFVLDAPPPPGFVLDAPPAAAPTYDTAQLDAINARQRREAEAREQAEAVAAAIEARRAAEPLKH